MPGQEAGRYLLVSDYDANCVRRYDAATGAFVDTFLPQHSGGLNQPQGLVFGPHDYNLYVASGELSGSTQRRAVLRFDGTTGAFIDEFAVGVPPPIDAQTQHIWAPHAVVFGPDGNQMIFLGGFRGLIQTFDQSFGPVSTFDEGYSAIVDMTFVGNQLHVLETFATETPWTPDTAGHPTQQRRKPTRNRKWVELSHWHGPRR